MGPAHAIAGWFINFGRWAPVPVNPWVGLVVHTFKSRGPSRRDVRPTKGRTVGSEWTKTEAADEAEAATTAARVKCLMRCARTVAKPRRFRLNRTPRGLSTAEIVSQSAGRDGSKIENGKRSNLFPFELPTRRAAGAELVFPYSCADSSRPGARWPNRLRHADLRRDPHRCLPRGRNCTPVVLAH
jgi:hypothetical protein